jgi:phosphotriesterase-related protein
MAKVQTITGEIDSADLGFTLMHEHIMIANPGMRAAYADWVDVKKVIEYATEEAKLVKACGVSTIVDLTPINLGRDLDVMRAVAEAAEIQVIAATGLYYNEEPWMGGWEPDRIAEWFVRDIEKGIEGTDAKAGIIKCATDHDGVTPINEKLLRAAAKTHRATGIPISTHTDPAADTGPAQQLVFEDEGVDLGRVVIGHTGDTNDFEYIERVLSKGSYIGMDRFGIDNPVDTDMRVKVIAELCQRGHADRMVLSHDACCHIDFAPQDVIEAGLRTVFKNWHFRHVPNDVIPALKAGGVTDDQIDAMTTANPRAIFEAQGGY